MSGAEPGECRVVEHRRPAPVQLGIQRLELGLRSGPIEDGHGHGGTHHVELIEAPLELAKRRVDVRQRQRDVGRELVRTAMRHLGEAVVAHTRRLDRVGFALEVRVVRGRAQDLHADAGQIHELEASRDVLGCVCGRMPKTRLMGSTQPRHQLRVALRVVVAVDVDH